MPIYEYQCASCATVFDNLQKITDPEPTECPHCDQPKISRRLTAPSFRLAGSGWYETDFKKEGDKKRNLAGDSSSDNGSASESTAKPDVTPAKTTTTPAPTSVSTPAATPANKADTSN